MYIEWYYYINASDENNQELFKLAAFPKYDGYVEYYSNSSKEDQLIEYLAQNISDLHVAYAILGFAYNIGATDKIKTILIMKGFTNIVAECDEIYMQEAKLRNITCQTIT